jgi:hypothetical protein
MSAEPLYVVVDSGSPVTAHGQRRPESLPETHARHVQQAAGLQNRRRLWTSDHDCVASDGGRSRLGADIMRKFVIILGFCLVVSPAAFAQTTTTDLNRPGQPAIAGRPFSPFPAPQYNVPGPQLTVPQTGNALQQAAPPGLSDPSLGSPTAQLSPLGSTVNPAQPTPGMPLGSIVNPVQPAPGGSTLNMVQQLGLQPQLQPGLPEAY